MDNKNSGKLLKIRATHTDLDNHINNVYDFSDIWHKKCSKYLSHELPDILPSVERIIVLGDIHGDWNMLQKMLRAGKLINEEGNWCGGKTVVVQVGDQIDRCRYKGVPCNQKGATHNDEHSDIRILEYFTTLHKQALEQGGAVYSLLGNHELMNVEGDFRYVSYEGIKGFENYKMPNGEIIEDGSDARREVFKPGNQLSEFLACTRRVAIVIGSNIFVHAGVIPYIASKYSVNSLNRIMMLYLLDMIDKNSRDIFDVHNFFDADVSPLWVRKFGYLGKEFNPDPKTLKENCDKLMKPLKSIYGVGKIYVGHTPQLKNGITSTCDDRIWLTDYGASAAFDGFGPQSQTSDSETQHRTAQVLEIRNDSEFTVLKLE